MMETASHDELATQMFIASKVWLQPIPVLNNGAKHWYLLKRLVIEFPNGHINMSTMGFLVH